jgi:hypothetical protein
MLTVTVLAKESSSSGDFEMESFYLPILIVIIIIVVVLLFVILKRRPKKEKPDDYFATQGAARQPPIAQAQGSQPPPPDAAMQQDLQPIAPPPDLVIERPEDDYYHPQHEHYTPTEETEETFDDSYIDFEPEETQEPTGAEDFSAMLPDESPGEASPQVEPKTVSSEPGTPPPQPQPTISKQPKVKSSGSVPKIVNKNDSS